jgi:hypothetical protein
MASSSTSAPSDEALWEELPEELLQRVLGHVKLEYMAQRRGVALCAEGVSERWWALRDAACQRLAIAEWWERTGRVGTA